MRSSFMTTEDAEDRRKNSVSTAFNLRVSVFPVVSLGALRNDAA
jgi:hypothetical protein